MTRALLFLVFLGMIAGGAAADVHDLTDGVLILHHDPSYWFSYGPCEDYYLLYEIDLPEDQYNRIDTASYALSVLFVLAAFPEDKQFCGVQFGLGEYDPSIFGVGSWAEACWPQGDDPSGIETPSGWWPGPGTGTQLVSTSGPWDGNLRLVYALAGYAYGYDGASGVVPLTVNPETGEGTFTNCEDPSVDFPVECFGGIGINTDGIYCAPHDGLGHVCCVAGDCLVVLADSCAALGGQFYSLWDNCVPNPCPEAIRRACCFAEDCQLLTEDDCAALGGEWQSEVGSCDPDPCFRACCVDEECQLTRESDCLFAGGEWHEEIDSCIPNPCWFQSACCLPGGCDVLTLTDCQALGGVWLNGTQGCDPDPCATSLRACCVGATCNLESGQQCEALGGIWMTGVETCDPLPCDGVYVVTPEGDGDFPTIQAAILAAEEGAVVELTDGIFDAPGNRGIHYFGKALTVRSQSGDPQSCVIKCTDSQGLEDRGFAFTHAETLDSVLDGISIIDGYGEYGGGIHCSGSSPTITNCIIAHCQGQRGGGVFCEHSYAEMAGCTIDSNYAWQGGGAYITDGAPTISRCQVVNNTGSNRGGGIFCFAGTRALLQSTIIAGNTTYGDGGGAATHESETTFLGCTFHGNHSDDMAGGLYVYGDPLPTIENTIIAFSSSGCAVYCTNDEPSFSCCNIYGNEGGDWAYGIQGQLGFDGNISEDPLFCGELLPNGPLQVQEDSPCAPHTPPNLQCALIGAGAPTCDSLEPLVYACCHQGECQMMTASECLHIGGSWRTGIEACDPDPCIQFTACCVGESCQMMSPPQCLVAGGVWQPGVPLCDPNPCVPYACCADAECQMLSGMDCVAIAGESLEGVDACTPNPCVSADLAGGVLMVHAIPDVQWSFGVDYCQRYQDEYAITNSYEQVNRIDPDTLVNESSIWYVLAAWDGPKEFCAVQFGMGEFDEQMFWFRGWGPCNGGGLEIASADWPGPHEGVQVLHDDRWQGNYVPIYQFGGEARYGGQIPLTIDEINGIGGFTNCELSADRFDAECYGTLGILTEGSACYHGGDLYACCIDTVCTVISQIACNGLAGEWRPGMVECDPNPCLSSDVDDLENVGGTRLLASRPNPVTEMVLLSFELGQAERARLAVYDATGRIVRTLVDSDLPAGQHTAAWKGQDDTGRPVPAGVYFYRMRWGDRSETKRLLLVR
ncbi:right-handed parallel beta-helix repeat-containing protein [Candidatus Eisenbacteria bacterium]|uniref:Right-handed parallel beta-helix repeat-containing protein n=1 Tax=Eiseniibacteriota bacterium TaxID=2212470 RepID=A0ABV6YLU0_UNCEI